MARIAALWCSRAASNITQVFFSRVVHSFQGLKKLEVDCEGGRRDVPVREWLLSQKHLEDLQIVNYRD